ncbi:MAG: YbhB/YbcL family Raf kinase inhibitor-like protein [Corynebacterium sp.]|nr:YbhB/YbcL family Raf kinase inhibitor-like protein [Corynebacterium sp.]
MTSNHDWASDARFVRPDPYTGLGTPPEFTLASADFERGTKIPAVHCAPSSRSPELHWDPAQLPANTMALAVTCFDPDAPTLSGYWHWAAFNLPATLTSIPAGAGSDASLGMNGVVSLRNDAGSRQYYGPQPPAGHGPHRYLFAVHALDNLLQIPAEATPTVLSFNLFFHTLARGVTWGWMEN